MANIVHLSGLLSIDEVRSVKGVGMLILATLFDQSKAKQQFSFESRGYPVYLTGKQADIVLEQNRKKCNGKLPQCVVNGRLFHLTKDEECIVLGKYIQFTGAYFSMKPEI